jgi:hypothetical protein
VQELEVGDEAGDQLRVVRLLDEIQLGAKVRLELVGEGAELEQPSRLRVALDELGRSPQQVEVERDLLDDARAPDLDDDLAAVLQQGRVDLRDRACRERLAIDACEDVAGECILDDPLDLLERQRRNLVDEPAELLDVHVRQQVRTRGEQLAELDERRAELLEGGAKGLCPILRRLAAADHADLAQDAQQLRATGDAGHLERPLQAPSARSHGRILRHGNDSVPHTEPRW